MLEPGLRCARAIFSLQWASDYGLREPQDAVDAVSRLHPALVSIRLRGSRWRLLLAGLAVHVLELNLDRIAEKLRREPRVDSVGQRSNPYADMLAELGTGLLVKQLGLEPEHEPTSPNPRTNVRPDWKGTAGATTLVFESKRRKRSEQMLARERALQIFIETLSFAVPDDGHLTIELGRAFDECTRQHVLVYEGVARQIALDVAARLPPADGVLHAVHDCVRITRTPTGGGWEIRPPPIDYTEDAAGVLQSIDTAYSQIKKFGTPGVIVIEPEEGLLAANYARAIVDHLGESQQLLAAVLLMLEPAPNARFLVFRGQAWSIVAPLLDRSTRRCPCGAAHVDVLTTPQSCVMAEAARCRSQASSCAVGAPACAVPASAPVQIIVPTP